MQFTKMQGAGNDYVYVDCFDQPVPEDLAETARQISDRHFGVGGDGLVLIRPAEPSENADARMQMFNADGSEAEMCGNAIRCVAKYLYDEGRTESQSLRIATAIGVLDVQLQIDAGGVERVRVDMGEPILDGAKIPTTLATGRVVDQTLVLPETSLAPEAAFQVSCVSMGNPHCVLFVEETTDELVLGVGPRIEVDRHFPNRVNVEFVEVVSRTELRQRTWERGSGETLACGTGASAVCVAGVLSGRTERTVAIHLRGGDLELEWAEDNHVYMTGPAEEVFRGDWAGPKSDARQR